MLLNSILYYKSPDFSRLTSCNVLRYNVLTVMSKTVFIGIFLLLWAGAVFAEPLISPEFPSDKLIIDHINYGYQQSRLPARVLKILGKHKISEGAWDVYFVYESERAQVLANRALVKLDTGYWLMDGKVLQKSYPPEGVWY